MTRQKYIRYDDLPDGVKRLNPQIPLQDCDDGVKTNSAISAIGGKTKTQGRAVSESEKGVPKMNKTETRFYEVLKRDFRDAIIVPQPTRFFRFPNGDTYTPDFLVIAQECVYVFEVKGGYRGPGWQQGYERYHRAKERFESERLRVSFQLVTWDAKRMEWSYE